uniref:Uncharacterized protein n=1 Tax=viral metagenome TaxID=1070528 RepID=A0A6H1ZNI1_9ZZZZ
MVEDLLIEVYQDIENKYVKIRGKDFLWMITPEDIRLNGKVLASLDEFAPDIYDDLLDKVCSSLFDSLQLIVKEIRR